jgi:hypothetical protein
MLAADLGECSDTALAAEKDTLKVWRSVLLMADMSAILSAAATAALMGI